MKVEPTVKGLRAAVNIAKKDKKFVGFVPTMGNLHAGHITLVKEAKARCDFVVVSIFVNPTQFGEGEDFDSYPRTLNADLDKLMDAGADVVFTPEVADMYPNYPQQTVVTVGDIANQLCGLNRPGHFDGVATVVSKLLGMVKPDVAFFGQKDYQQLAVIRQVVADLAIDSDIVGIPTVRADDGLALSSRNGYLSEDERKKAVLLSKCLKKVGGYLLQGDKDYAKLEKAASKFLTESGFEVDYIRIKTPELNEPTAEDTKWVVLAAAKMGKPRLIDNMTFGQ